MMNTTNPVNARYGKSRLRARAAAVIAVLASIAAMTPALGADAKETDPYNVSFTAFFVTKTDGSIQADRSAGPVNIGTSIDWHRDLGGDTNMTVPRIDGYYRFNAHNRIDFSWYNINRDGTITTQRDIDFGNVHYPAGTAINSTLDTQTIKAAYTYSFYRAREIETSLSLGVYVTDVKATLQSTGLGVSEAQSTTAPLPVFGFRIDYALTPKLWVRSKYELFFLDRLDTVQGALSDFTLQIEHHTFKHIGFGLGLDRNSTDFNVYKDPKSIEFSSVLTGFMLYVVVR